MLTVSLLASAKVAVTASSAAIDTVQVVDVPEQAPDQPVKSEPVAAAAVRVAVVPLSRVTLQVEPQLTPEPLTVPPPAPALLTDSE